MLVIGLTGRSCAGKNRYADEFGAQEGVTVIDVDRLGHAALAANADSIVETFGSGLLAADGSIDRKALGSIVFADSRLLAQLEAISHPWMVEECARLVSAARASGRRAVVLNAALLHRMGLDRLCDVVVFIKAPFYERYRRAKERDHVSWQMFRRREQAQADIDPDAFGDARIVLVWRNDGDPSLIHRQVVEFCDTMDKTISLSQG